MTGWLMQRFAQDAPGSGIPQVKEAYASRNFDFSWNLLWVKFFGGVLSIGTGSSLGREGPTIHIGAAAASKVARWAKETKEAKANAVCAGAAAGLAAAFNSPLAGVTLVLEEIAESQNMDKYAGRCLLASAISVSMVYLSRLPLWLRPAIGALIGGIFCVIAFKMTSRLGAFGLGEIDLRAALNNQIVWHAAAWLLAAKLMATIFCYGTGGCGGIFAPLIFFGGMCGLIIYGFTEKWLYLEHKDQTLLSLIGMTATLGAVVRAPLTSILIVFEMTRQVNVLPALMVAGVIAALINTFLFHSNFYNASLKQDEALKHLEKPNLNLIN